MNMNIMLQRKKNQSILDNNDPPPTLKPYGPNTIEN